MCAKFVCSNYVAAQKTAKKLNEEQEAQLQRLQRDLGETETSAASGLKTFFSWYKVTGSTLTVLSLPFAITCSNSISQQLALRS